MATWTSARAQRARMRGITMGDGMDIDTPPSDDLKAALQRTFTDSDQPPIKDAPTEAHPRGLQIQRSEFNQHVSDDVIEWIRSSRLEHC